MSNEVERCQECRFFIETQRAGVIVIGECRRHAPAKDGGTSALAKWPKLHGGCWCGEFERAREWKSLEQRRDEEEQNGG